MFHYGTKKSQKSRPFLTSRPTKKREAWQPVPWQDRHHVVPSLGNKHVRKNQRWYFDTLSAVSWKRGEFNDIVSFQGQKCDLEDHRENIRRIFVQFPQYVPPVCKGKNSRSRMLGNKHADSRETVDMNLPPPKSPKSPCSQTILAETATQTEFEDDVIAFCQNREVQHSLRQIDNVNPKSLDDRTQDPQLDPPRLLAPLKNSLTVQSDEENTRGSPSRSSGVGSALGQVRGPSPNPSDKHHHAQLWAAAKKQLAIEADCAPTHLLNEWCKLKRTHVVTVWRRLDKDMSMHLQKLEFVQGMKSLSYPENLEELWVSLDRDHTGNVSFLEFAPDHALDLARFKYWVEDHFGDMHDFFHHLDTDRNGKLCFSEFRAACDMEGMPDRLQESIRTLFLLVDDPDDITSKGTITESELQFLANWKSPVYLREQPDLSARMMFQDALLSLHDRNPLMAWRVALDRDGSMRVGFSEFAATCRDLTRAGFKEADPPSGVPALYTAFDVNRSGWFTLRDWDRQTYTLLQKFHTFCIEKHSKVAEFVRSVDPTGSGMTSGQFSRAIADLDFDFDDRHMIFDGLSLGKNKRQNIMGSKPNKKIYVQDLMFLDHWHPEEEMRADMAWERKIMKRMSTFVKDPLTGGSFLTRREGQDDDDSPRRSRFL